MFPLPDGQPLVAHSLRPYLQTGEPIMLVVHPEHLLFQQWLNQQGIPFTCCPDAESGMGHSLRWGIQKTADWPWWGIALADMPWLDKQILNQLAGSVREDRIYVPVCGGLQRHPVIFAALCGLVLAGLGIATGGHVFGTGYEEARSLLQDEAMVGAEFGAVKFLANLVSYVAGIPGGIFSPALAVGAGIGSNVASFLPSVDPSTLVLLGMCAYLAGVTQAPLTSAVISLELTSNQTMVLPIMAVCLIARAVSALLCPTPLYRSLANRLLDPTAPDDARTAEQPTSKAAEEDDDSTDDAEPTSPPVPAPILPVDPSEDGHSTTAKQDENGQSAKTMQDSDTDNNDADSAGTSANTPNIDSKP